MHQMIPEKLVWINQAIEENTTDDLSLFFGRAGILYYYYQEYLLTGNTTAATKCYRFANELAGQVFEQQINNPDIALSTGITGICSVLHLVQQGNIIPQLPPGADAVDEYLFTRALMDNNPNTFDFTSGMTGITSYFCKRTQTPVVRRYLIALTSHLLTALKQEANNTTEVNFSLWKGLSGKISLLLRLLRHFPKNEEIHIAIQRQINLAQKHIMPIDEGLSRFGFFPASVDEKTGLINAPNHLFWEEGDLGIILAFYQFHNMIGGGDFKKLADLAGAYSLTRKNDDQTHIQEPGFSRGACGTALMYLLLQRESGLRNYNKGYYYWISRSITLFDEQLTNNRFANRMHDFKTGLPGIALTWLSYLNRSNTAWLNLFIP
jgi:lantibiotic modifying enzyme